MATGAPTAVTDAGGGHDERAAPDSAAVLTLALVAILRGSPQMPVVARALAQLLVGRAFVAAALARSGYDTGADAAARGGAALTSDGSGTGNSAVAVADDGAGVPAAGPMAVTVEAAGSGKVLVPRLILPATATVLEVQEAVRAEIVRKASSGGGGGGGDGGGGDGGGGSGGSPQAITASSLFKLLLGHGGHELGAESDGKTSSRAAATAAAQHHHSARAMLRRARDVGLADGAVLVLLPQLVDAKTQRQFDAVLAVGAASLEKAPSVKWDDVVGHHQVKLSLKERLILPARFPSLFTGARVPHGATMLYGPPGVGKSLLAAAVAAESGAALLRVQSGMLGSSRHPAVTGEAMVKVLVDMARAHRPCVMVLEDLEALAARGGAGADHEHEPTAARRAMNQLLIEMSRLSCARDGVAVLGITNRPWDVNLALRRRFSTRLFMSLPAENDRKRLVSQLLLARSSQHLGAFAVGTSAAAGTTPASVGGGGGGGESDLDRVVEATCGFTGADLTYLVRDALTVPMQQCLQATHFRWLPEAERWVPCGPDDEGAQRMGLGDVAGAVALPTVDMGHFRVALRRNHPSVNAGDLAPLLRWTADFGTELPPCNDTNVGV